METASNQDHMSMGMQKKLGTIFKGEGQMSESDEYFLT